jgi:hypothetical protein
LVAVDQNSVARLEERGNLIEGSICPCRSHKIRRGV